MMTAVEAARMKISRGEQVTDAHVEAFGLCVRLELRAAKLFDACERLIRSQAFLVDGDVEAFDDMQQLIHEIRDNPFTLASEM